MANEENGHGEVLVGNKPVMNYVFAIVTRLGLGDKEIHVKARGKAISKAVDVAEIARRRFENSLVVEDLKIGTEMLTDKNGNEQPVSFIEIVLKKKE